MSIMQNIGLMMTYNEEDIIEEVMEANKKYFDKIFVLDGSTDKTEKIIRSFDNVKYFLKEQDIFPKRKIYCGSRQFLLEKAQEMYGCEGWFTLLHADEIFVDNPTETIIRAEKVKAEIINWHMLNFFLHSSQRETYDPKKPIQEQVIYYQPGGLEVRQFKNKPGLFYNINRRNYVLPNGLKLKPFLDYPIIKHYVKRSINQFVNRPSTGFGRDKQVLDQLAKQPPDLNYDNIFLDVLEPQKKQVRKYDGSFHEFEPGNRPAFFWQWLAWRKYKPIEWGALEPIAKIFQRK